MISLRNVLLSHLKFWKKFLILYLCNWGLSSRFSLLLMHVDYMYNYLVLHFCSLYDEILFFFLVRFTTFIACSSRSLVHWYLIKCHYCRLVWLEKNLLAPLRIGWYTLSIVQIQELWLFSFVAVGWFLHFILLQNMSAELFLSKYGRLYELIQIFSIFAVFSVSTYC